MTFNYDTATLAEILDHVKADGIVDADEVTSLRTRLYADGVIDRDEGNFLFDLNDATTGNTGHDPGWQALFVEALSAHVLEDDESPGEIDADEAAWLVSKMESDGQIDGNERALLTAIKAKATKIGSALQALIDAQGV